MSESLYVPMGLLAAGVIAWLTAGAVFIAAPNSSMPKDLLTAGTGAMALGGTAYQAQIQSQSSTKRKSTPRRQTKAKPDSNATP
jgi:multisubunit Na+/H+ antiporter MnhG subunit